MVLIVAIIFIIFSMLLSFVDRLYSLVKTYASLPTAEFLVNLVFLLLTGLLWLSYRYWREATKKQAELENIIESISPDVLIVVDPKKNIIMCNASLKRMFGYEVDEVIDQKTDLLYFDRRSNPGQRHQISGTLGRESFSVELATGKKKDGTTIPLEIISGNLHGRGGAVMLLRDITERKQIDQMKSEFISLVSHQLRTPAALIRGYIDNMLAGLTGDLKVRQREYLQEMREISSKNCRFISDLLNVSRIERGVIATDIKPIKLSEVVRFAVRDHHEGIKKKGLILNLEGMDNEIIVLADTGKMTEALSNVLDNAVKFTNEGSIIIKTKSENGFGIVEVADTGKGISDDSLNKLFTKDQVLSGDPTPQGGASLGLYIAKKFMKLQHGGISVTSIEGKGSSFSLKIPLAKV
jgi:PAS domain S-box-containing protein